MDAEARLHAIADSFIFLLSSCLFFSVNFLESFSPSISIALSEEFVNSGNSILHPTKGLHYEFSGN